MFIIKFNNMVKNKWIWAAFAILVAVAFGASDMLATAGRDSGSSDGYGQLNGKPVDADLYQAVERYERFMNRFENGAAEYDAKQVWRSYATVVRAREMGIVIPDTQLARMIQNDPTFFGPDRTFDSRIYQLRLRELDLTPVWYQEVLRVFLTIQQVRSLASQGAYVPAALANERARGITDSYTLLPATLTNTHTAASVTVKPEEIRSFYETHPDFYRLPERRRVAMVTFKSADYIGEVTVEQDDVFDYYESNPQLFSVKGTNGVDVVREFEECSADVEKAYAEELARDMAYNHAGTFADRFIDISGTAAVTLDFGAEAAAAGYTVVTTDWFTASAPPVKYMVAEAFSDAVFSLDPEGETVSERIADPVGSADCDEAYVAVLLEVSPTHVPAFEQVSARVENDARLSQAESEFQADIVRIREGLLQGAAADKAFADTARELGLTVGTNVVLTSMDAFGDHPPIESARSVVVEMRKLGKGEFTESPVPVANGAMFFQVVDRVPGDSSSFSVAEMQAKRALNDQIGEALWTAWQENNLMSLNPEPAFPWEDAAYDAEEDEDVEVDDEDEDA